MDREAGVLGGFDIILSKLETIPENKFKLYLHRVRKSINNGR
jgi:hypothetical protein